MISALNALLMLLLLQETYAPSVWDGLLYMETGHLKFSS